jgi:hypothetical protein
MKTYLLFSVFFLFCIACKNNQNSNQQDSADDTSTADSTATMANILFTFEFDCQENAEPSEATGMPTFKVFVKSDALSEAVYIKDLNLCSDVQKDQYENLGIPSTAIDAVNGWFAGGGPILYGNMSATNELLIMEGWQEEGNNAPIEYKAIKKIMLKENGETKVEDM